jgi:hypothetical protein
VRNIIGEKLYVTAKILELFVSISVMLAVIKRINKKEERSKTITAINLNLPSCFFV